MWRTENRRIIGILVLLENAFQKNTKTYGAKRRLLLHSSIQKCCHQNKKLFRGLFRTQSRIYNEVFCKKYLPASQLVHDVVTTLVRSNAVTTLFLQCRCPDQNLTLLQRRVFNVSFPTRY